jgi:hypothetical protein
MIRELPPRIWKAFLMMLPARPWRMFPDVFAKHLHSDIQFNIMTPRWSMLVFARRVWNSSSYSKNHGRFSHYKGDFPLHNLVIHRWIMKYHNLRNILHSKKRTTFMICLWEILCRLESVFERNHRIWRVHARLICYECNNIGGCSSSISKFTSHLSGCVLVEFREWDGQTLSPLVSSFR